MINVLDLTKRLIAMDTVNPPGNEYFAAKYVGGLLEENGFDVEYVPFEGKRILHDNALRNR